MLMSLLHRTTAGAAEESGSVLVMFAVFASVAILMSAFVLSVGSWFAHKRHLQVQADAAVLAAAQAFQYPCAKTVKEAIYSTAGRYGGAASVNAAEEGTFTSATPLYNEQIGGTSQGNIHEGVNKKKYFEQSAEDNTVEKAPCEPQANMIDVKLTETNLPWFFKAANVSFINAHARVSVSAEGATSGVQPLAVAETSPIAAKAYFVNEDEASQVLGESKLKLASNGQEWGSEEAVPVAINKTNATTAHIGVVIALSGSEKAPQAAGNLATKCKEAYVQCFDQTATGPLLHIAGYSEQGSGTLKKPLAREVTLSSLTPNTCTDGYFSYSTSNCTFTIKANGIYYGSTNTTGVTVTPVIGGKKSSTPLNKPAKATEPWIGTAAALAAGSNEISLLVECEQKATSPCPTEATKETISDVQRLYAAPSAHSGPITGAWISEPGGTPPVPGKEGADSYRVCEGSHVGASCTPHLAVTIHAEGGLADAAQCKGEAECKAVKGGFFDPVRSLKFEGNGGVIYECKPGENPSASTYREHLREGCPYTYKLNEQSGGAFSDPNCTAENPYDCIAVGEPGNKNGAEKGVKERFQTNPPAGTSFKCHNLWQNKNNGGVPMIPPDDSRIVQVFVIPYGAINEKGEPTGNLQAAPIEAFATFYVTGFTGDTCKLSPQEKEEKWTPDDPVSGFEIVGHFIKYVNVLGESSGAECKAEASAIETCVATLTE
jgi:Putative Flp pilus-assembly TadE/G-like